METLHLVFYKFLPFTKVGMKKKKKGETKCAETQARFTSKRSCIAQYT